MTYQGPSVFDPAGRYLVAGGFPDSEVYFKPLRGGEPRRLSVVAGQGVSVRSFSIWPATP